MREILVAAVLYLVSCALASQDKCQSFTCSESPSDFGSCFTENSDKQEIIMSKCNFECKILLSQILTNEGQISLEKLKTQEKCTSNSSLKSSERLKYSGEQCQGNSQCYSNDCKNNLCVGASEGETCNDSENIFCNNNLSCNNFKCTKLLDIGQPCKSSSQCQVNSICDVSKRICSLEESSNNHLSFKLTPLSLSLYCKDFEVTKDSKCIERNDLNTSSNLVVFACPKTQICQYSGALQCNIFNQQYNYAQSGNIPSNLHAYLTSLRKTILSKNKLCPRSLEFSQDCSLITEELSQFEEASVVFNNFSRILNMPKCLLQTLKYPEAYKLLLSEFELSQFPQEIDNSVSYYWMLLGAAVITVGISRFAILKKRKADAIAQQINGGILPQSTPTNKVQVGYEKQSSANVSLRNDNNKEQLNLERNPTAGKAEELEISCHDQDNLENQKKEGLEISVHQNFFSIDGQDDEEKEKKEVESLGDSQSEGDMSYENVFNLEGGSVEKHPKKRRRATNRKKIIKKDSENKYEVVEE